MTTDIAVLCGLLERLQSLANEIDPLLLGGPDARLLNEAADAITALLDELEAARAENEKFRRALWKIIHTDDQIGFASGAPSPSADLARAALAPKDAQP